MPRTVFDKQPEIDWLLAAILERKMKTGMDWNVLAEKAHCTPAALRKMASSRHTDDWKPEIRRSVCRSLGISTKTLITAEVELR